VQHYSAGLELAPNNSVLHANRAMAYLKTGGFQSAEQDCNACLRLDANNVKALLRRGTARYQMDRVEEALEDFETVLALEPNNVEAVKESARIRRLLELEGDD
jgi:tetratricopeptide (TPR) repeat protein